MQGNRIQSFPGIGRVNNNPFLIYGRIRMEYNPENNISLPGKVRFPQGGIGYKVVRITGKGSVGARPLGARAVLAIVLTPRTFVGSIAVQDWPSSMEYCT